MDNSLKAFEVGNRHLYGPEHTQAMVSLSAMNTPCGSDTFPPSLL